MTSRIAATLCALGALALLIPATADAQQDLAASPSTPAPSTATKPTTAKATSLGSWLVGKWGVFKWADRADPGAPQAGTMEFFADGRMVMYADGTDTFRYTLNASRTPAWIDLSGDSDQEVIPGLLERIDQNTARLATYPGAKPHPTKFGEGNRDALLRRIGREAKPVAAGPVVDAALAPLVGIWDVVPWEYRDRGVEKGAMTLEIRADGTLVQRGKDFFFLKANPQPDPMTSQRVIQGRVRAATRPGPDWVDFEYSTGTAPGLFERQGADRIKLEVFLRDISMALVGGKRPTQFSDADMSFSPYAMYIYQLERRSALPAAAVESAPAPPAAQRPLSTPAPVGLFDTAGLEIVRLGPPISGARTCEDEPFYEPDGNALIFKRSEPGRGGKSLGFFRSERTATGWGAPIPYAVPDGATSPTLSPDGQSLYLAMRAKVDAFGGESWDLYVSKRVGGSWGTPQNLGPVINSPWEDETPALGPDGNTLVFSSDRPGGAGYHDLWIATRTADGAWTPPRNLGPAVNGKYHENYPQLSSDGRTLYFDSYDDRPPPGLYRTEFDGVSWSAPRRISVFPRDGTKYESRLVPAPNGREAVFSANRPEVTGDCTDLFMVRVAAQPARRAWRLEYKNSTGHWTGDLEVQPRRGGWIGRIRFDQQGQQWQELRDVTVTAQGIRFVRGDQVYVGRFLGGGRVAGTFTWSGREWDWAGQEMQLK